MLHDFLFKGLEIPPGSRNLWITWLKRTAYRMMDAQVCLPSEVYKAPSGSPYINFLKTGETHGFLQWAAVSTHCEPTRTPPHSK